MPAGYVAASTLVMWHEGVPAPSAGIMLLCLIPAFATLALSAWELCQARGVLLRTAQASPERRAGQARGAWLPPLPEQGGGPSGPDKQKPVKCKAPMRCVAVWVATSRLV
jgi:hypothetical protein